MNDLFCYFINFRIKSITLFLFVSCLFYQCSIKKYVHCTTFETCVLHWSIGNLLESDTVVVDEFYPGYLSHVKDVPNFIIVHKDDGVFFGLYDENLRIKKIPKKTRIIIHKIIEDYSFSIFPPGIGKRLNNDCDKYCIIDQVFICTIDTTSF